MEKLVREKTSTYGYILEFFRSIKNGLSELVKPDEEEIKEGLDSMNSEKLSGEDAEILEQLRKSEKDIDIKISKYNQERAANFKNQLKTSVNDEENEIEEDIKVESKDHEKSER